MGEATSNDEHPELVEQFSVTAGIIFDDFEQRHIHPLTNPTVYTEIQSLPRDVRHGLLLHNKTAINTAETVQKVGEILGEQFTTCLFHPGILVRAHDFTRYTLSAREENPEITPIEAIHGFSIELGTRTVFRCMALTPSEAENIKQIGIMAPAFRRKDTGTKALVTLLHPPRRQIFWDPNTKYPSSFEEDISFRIFDKATLHQAFSISCSTSDFRDVAASVGWHDSKRTDLADCQPYVFTLDIPTVLTYNEQAMSTEVRGIQRLVIGNQKFEGLGLEVFTPFGITPSAIRNTETIPIPPSWTRVPKA